MAKIMKESEFLAYVDKRARQLIQERKEQLIKEWSEEANTKANQTKSNKIKSAKEDKKLFGAKNSPGNSLPNADFFKKYAGGKEDVKIDGEGNWSEKGKEQDGNGVQKPKVEKRDFLAGKKGAKPSKFSS